MLADSVLRELDADRRREWAKHGVEVARDGVSYRGQKILEVADLQDTRTRHTLNARYVEAFNAYVRAGAEVALHGRGVENRALDLLTNSQRNALREGTAEGGGYLAPPALLAEVVRQRAALTVVRAAGVRAVRVNSPRLEVPVTTAHGSSPDAYAGAWVGSWLGEVPSDAFASSSGPTLGLSNASLRKYITAVRVSNDLIADASTDVVDWLLSDGSANVAVAEDAAFLTGNGIDAPLGLVPQFAANGGTTTDIEGTTSNTISNTVGDLGSATKLQDMSFALASQYQRGARWAMRSATEGKIRKLVNASGDWLWPRTGFDLLGFPVSHSDAIAADAVDGNLPVIFGDFAAAAIIGEQPLSARIVDGLNPREDQAALVLVQRSAVVLTNVRALKVGIV